MGVRNENFRIPLIKITALIDVTVYLPRKLYPLTSLEIKAEKESTGPSMNRATAKPCGVFLQMAELYT